MDVDIRAECYEIGARVQFGKNTTIRCRGLHIGPDCTFGDGTLIDVHGDVWIGRCGIFGPRLVMRGSAVCIDEYAYVREDVEVGGGQCYGQFSRLLVGHSLFVAEGKVLNLTNQITLGDEVGLGANFWTHGGYLSVVDGYPGGSAPITVGDRVWLPQGINVLQGVTIGSDVVVGAMSLVNRNLPSGCFAAGVPCKIITEHRFPRPFDLATLSTICTDWKCRMIWLGYLGYPGVVWDASKPGILEVDGTTFDIPNRGWDGEAMSVIAEDFRNTLRQWGIRIRTGKPYKAIDRRK